ncbi:universal stress protein [Brevibacillus sp. B_LB10_24]|uniref:universal stress protein n=1 Tax=Brevibacillus sp. B_LB10_24 TaxID=3380645 RepID=UPI0038B93C38
MFDKILVAIDGSEMSRKAFEAALSIAKSNQARLTILHAGKEAVFSSSWIGGAMYIPQGQFAEMMEEVEKEGNKLLSHAKKLAEEAGVDAETLYVKGDPALTILEKGKAGGFKLIVVGSRGLSGIKEMMLGSVSHKVSQLASCPVLIVH